jgi:hypothetical protein
VEGKKKLQRAGDLRSGMEDLGRVEGIMEREHAWGENPEKMGRYGGQNEEKVKAVQ